MPAPTQTPPPLPTRRVGADTLHEPAARVLLVPARVHLLCAGVVLTAMTIVTEPIGAQWLLIAVLGLLAVAAVPLGQPDDHGGRPLLRGLTAAVLIVALSAAAAVSTDALLVGICLASAAAIAVAQVFPSRPAVSTFRRAVAFVAAASRAIPWLTESLGERRRVPWAGVVRAGVMVIPAVAVLGLLASADATFAAVLHAMVPVGMFGDPVAYVVTAGLALMFVGTLAYLRAMPPRIATKSPLNRAQFEWLVPVATMDAVLVLFLGVRAAELFGAVPASGAAHQARAGFVKLVLVTIVVTLVLQRTARIAPVGRRRLALWAAPAYLGNLIVLVSALRGLWSYQSSMGWTVARLEAMAFEVWLGAALVVMALGWWSRRERQAARLLSISAAVSVLALTVVSPAALVADWHVARYARTGALDVVYLRSLPDDATPHLAVLPMAVRCQVLNEGPAAARWYAINLRREQARAAIAAAHCK